MHRTLQSPQRRFVSARLLGALPALLLCTSPLSAADPPFSVEQVLSSPFPSSMTAAPAGGHVAWVMDERGERNVWVASSADWQARKLTAFARDDGQEISSLTWSPDGQRLAFVRGGPPNSAGELPNPEHIPAGIEREIWIVDLAEGTAREVSQGSSPLLTADALLYQHQGKIWRLPLGSMQKKGDEEDHETPKSEALIAVRGNLGNLRLSPDASKLAVVSSRGTHSFIGVYDFGSASLRYLDPAVDRDVSPVWSPDGKRIAFIRHPARLELTLFGPMREAEPWSIRLVDVDSGVGRELWRANEGPGSVFHGVVADDQLFWTRGGRIVFPWEGNGWTHLYSLDPAQPSPRAQLLTPGDGEVEYVTRTADGSGVIFSSNQGDIDRRHLWQIGADGTVRPLTDGEGVENDPAAISDDCCVAFVRATGQRPLLPAVRLADGSIRDLVELPASFPLEHMIAPEPVRFAATDGLEIHGQLFLPPDRFEGPRPALLYFHGGSRRHMMLGWHYSSYYHDCYAFHQFMANQGYVVLSVNYRSGIGYGLEFREALDYGATGASELHDVLGAGIYLRSRPDVAKDSIGLWGGSYGGYLTAMGLAHASDLFAAGVDIHGVHDWNRTIKNFVPSYEPLEDPERTRLAFESSPLGAVEGWRSPVLLIHADDDRNVPFTETIELVEKLRALGVEHELLVFPDDVHGFLLQRHWIELFERAGEFFDRHLSLVEVATPAAETATSGQPR